MPDADRHARVRKRLHVGGRRLFRGQRDHQRKVTLAQKILHVAGVERAQKSLRVDAAPGRREPGTFEMQPEKAGHRLADPLFDSVQRRLQLAALVGDQRGHDARDAEPCVRCRNRAQGLHGGRIVEQRAPAAIHLYIDQARREHAIERLGVRRDAWRQGGYRAVADLKGRGLQDLRAGEHACGRERRHQRVSVILLSMGGLSGERPRRSAASLANR